jgi:hypothetical protein
MTLPKPYTAAELLEIGKTAEFEHGRLFDEATEEGLAQVLYNLAKWNAPSRRSRVRGRDIDAMISPMLAAFRLGYAVAEREQGAGMVRRLKDRQPDSQD